MSKKYSIQSKDANTTVKVCNEFSRDRQCEATGFIIAEKGSNQHRHIIIGEDGSEIYNGLNDNSKKK